MTANPVARPPRTKPSVTAKGLPKLNKHVMMVVAPIICIGLCLLIWQGLCQDPASKMPAPLKVVTESAGAIFKENGIFTQLMTSLQRVALGYALSAIVGVAVGVLIGVSPFLRFGFDPLIQILRTIPPLAWLPLALAMFQESKAAALFLIFITAIWPIIINTVVGVQQIPKDYNNVAKVLQLSGKEYFFNILIPATVPYIFTGLRIGIGLAWLAIVAAEMLASGAGGIGFFIWDAYNAGNADSMSQIILAVLCVGLVGLALDRLVGWLGTKVVADY
jgi:nitrate/nitrite transport system permease protein